MSNRSHVNYSLYGYLIVISILFLFSYAENLHWLWAKWMENPDYSHGPLIPVISAFIVWQKRKSLEGIEKNGANEGLFLILGAILFRIIGLRGQVSFISSYSFILLLIGIILFLFGGHVLRMVLFPVLFLLFMVPFWGVPIAKFSNMLKLLSSVFSTDVMKSIGYAIHREGVILYLPKGTLEVADPCSGIRSLISLLALGTLIAYCADGPLYKKSILVLCTVPLAFLGNTMRIIFFGIFLETKGIMISEGFLHTVTGVCVFAFAFLGVMILKKCMKI